MGAVKFLSKIFGRCPKITTKHKQVPELRYPSQLVTRVPKKFLGTVEYQRKKQNTIWNLNDQTTGETRNHGWKN
jgi:hypothetical protein